MPDPIVTPPVTPPAAPPATPPVVPPVVPPGTPPVVPPAAPPVVPPGTPPAAPPVAFDWKGNGATPEGEALVSQRQWKNPGELLHSYQNLEKLTGVPANQIIKIPSNNDSTEWEAVYTKLGRPADAAGYKLPVPEGDDGKFAQEASKWMHEAGLSENAGRKIAEKWNTHLATMNQAENDKVILQNTTDTAALKVAWGPNYQANSDIVDRAAQSFGMSDVQLGALKVALGSKAAMEFMFNIGSKVAIEDKELIRNPDGSLGFEGMTPDVAKGEIQRLMKDKSFSQQFNSTDPKTRQESREKMSRLQKMAYPITPGA